MSEVKERYPRTVDCADGQVELDAHAGRLSADPEVAAAAPAALHPLHLPAAGGVAAADTSILQAATTDRRSYLRYDVVCAEKFVEGAVGDADAVFAVGVEALLVL